MKRQTRKLLLNIATGVAVATTAAVIFLPAAQAAPAQLTGNVNVRSGPGANYAVIDTATRGTTVDVRQCQASYCQVRGSGINGWVAANYLSGPGARPAPSQPGIGINIGPNGPSLTFNPGNQLPVPAIEDDDDATSQVCFYDRTRFRGPSICLDQGQTVRNLGNLSERVSSIDNPDGLRVQVCGDDGECRTYTSSASSLGDFDNYIVTARVR